MNDLFDQLGEELDEVGATLGGAASAAGTVRVDVLERDDEVVVRADLPGVDTDDLELTVSDRQLTIRAPAAAQTDEEGAAEEHRYHLRERRTGGLDRRLHLPAAVVEEEATASYDDGVLTVVLPKRTAAEEGTRIDVE